MLNIRLLVAQLAVLGVLLLIVLYGLMHGSLWEVAWYSASAHLLGGLWVALFAAWGQSMLHFRHSLITCISAALVFGVCWEIFECIIDATHFPADTVDTVADIFMDIAGGTAGAFFARYIWARG